MTWGIQSREQIDELEGSLGVNINQMLQTLLVIFDCLVHNTNKLCTCYVKYKCIPNQLHFSSWSNFCILGCSSSTASTLCTLIFFKHSTFQKTDTQLFVNQWCFNMRSLQLEVIFGYNHSYIKPSSGPLRAGPTSLTNYNTITLNLISQQVALSAQPPHYHD